jgi:hypothetical protein
MSRPSSLAPAACPTELRARAGSRLALPAACAAYLACIAAGVSLPGPARAYSTPDAYAEQPVLGGGGGRWFSGSPADGFGCTVCHAPGKGQREFPLRVGGLPADGYAPGQRHEIVLAWPEFAARWTELRPNPGAPPVVGQPSPAVGLVAELVPESGLGSGTIEIDSASATADELCEMTRPNLKPRLAARLYQVRPGIAPLQIRPDSTGMLRCEARQLGQRCVIALSSCGSKLLRFAWTAPPTWEGPIWFSAGFVASEALSGTPADDAVDEVSVPIVQADAKSDDYRQLLQGGCGLSPAPARAIGGERRGVGLGLGLALTALVVRRRRAAHRKGGTR